VTGHALDDVALLIDGLVLSVLDFAVLARRGDGLGTTLVEPLAQSLAVIAFVGDALGGGSQSFDAEPRHLAIVDVAGRQEQDVRAAFGIADRMELGVPSTFGAADTTSQGPLFLHPHSGGP